MRAPSSRSDSDGRRSRASPAPSSPSGKRPDGKKPDGRKPDGKKPAAAAARLHLIKLSVGTEDPEDLDRWQQQRLSETGRLFHRTRMHPKREAELLDGGSIYWVIRGLVRCRQRLTGLERGPDSEGRPATLLLLDPKLVLVEPVPHRAFQGWRYLEPARAPRDLAAGADDLPAALAAELRQLGVW